MTKITLTNQYGTYTIERDLDNLSIDKFIEDFIIPLLLSMGYDRENIDSCFTE